VAREARRLVLLGAAALLAAGSARAVTIRVQDPEWPTWPEGRLLTLEARPQRLGWWTAVPHGPLQLSAWRSVRVTTVPDLWAGCVTYRGRLIDPPRAPGGAPHQSAASKELVKGKCLEPAPPVIGVSEPGAPLGLLAGAALLWGLRRRRQALETYGGAPRGGRPPVN